MQGGVSMKDQDQIYRDLQKDLNQQPVGFPATKSGSEIRLLKRFFNPGEARVAMTLSYRPRPLREIYEDVREKGIAFGEVRNTQNAMANKGVIGEIEEELYETIMARKKGTLGKVKLAAKLMLQR
jgi:hypothetical protein